MGLRTRLLNIFKSNIDHIISCAEDPEKIINNSINEMEDGYEKAKAKVKDLKNKLDRNKSFKESLADQIHALEIDARNYVKDGMDENAKEAIRKRRTLDDIKNRLDSKIAQQEIEYSELDKRIKGIHERVLLVKNKRNILIDDLYVGRGCAGDIQVEKYPYYIEDKVDKSYKTFRKMEEKLNQNIEHAYKQFSDERARIDRNEKAINEELNFLKQQIKEGGKK